MIHHSNPVQRGERRRQGRHQGSTFTLDLRAFTEPMNGGQAVGALLHLQRNSKLIKFITELGSVTKTDVTPLDEKLRDN